MPEVIGVGNEYVNQIILFLVLVAAKPLVASSKSKHFTILLSMDNIAHSESLNCLAAGLRWHWMSLSLEELLSHDALIFSWVTGTRLFIHLV